METDHSGLSEERAEQKSVLPAARDHGKTYYYWLRKLRTAAVEQAAPEIVELEPEEGKQADVLYIRYRGAELTLPAETDIEAIAAVLRSLQRL